MKLFSGLKRVIERLEPRTGSWAVCGGIAASLYRENARFTADIDIALIDTEQLKARALAERVLKELGYKPALGFVPDFEKKGGQRLALILSREGENERFEGIDFLLPVFPWVPGAVRRGQSNLIDYGFARVPTITAEDIIISKLFALRGGDPRAIDKDDILSILQSQKVDREYILRRAKSYSLAIPRWAKGLK